MCRIFSYYPLFNSVWGYYDNKSIIVNLLYVKNLVVLDTFELSENLPSGPHLPLDFQGGRI